MRTDCIYQLTIVAYSEVNLATQHAVEHLILTQVGMKKGIKIWGEKGVTAITKEMKQFHDRNVFSPLKLEDITPEVKNKALGYLMF